MWVCAAPPTASARRETTVSYPFSRVWTAAVRLVRVDLECPVTEKDKDDGYFFFEYTDHGKKFPGSVELVSIQESGVDQVRVIVKVPAMPAYVEAMILDKLSRKLEQEFGPPKAPQPPKVAESEAGKDEKDEKGTARAPVPKRPAVR
jgi:hypothetical protein